jgi:hypothetical protein
VACFPFQISGAGRLDPALATRVLLLVPLDPQLASLDVMDGDPARLDAIQRDIDRGALALRAEYPLRDMHVALRIYVRTTAPQRTVDCQG